MNRAVAKRVNPVLLKTTLRVVVGLVFLYAGMVKVRSPENFAASIAGFRMLPAAWVPGIAHSLPFFEAILGFWLVLGWRYRAPARAALLLSAVFTLALAQAFARGLNPDCGCFGQGSAGAPSLALPLARDLLLLVGAWLVFREAASAAQGASGDATAGSVSARKE